MRRIAILLAAIAAFALPAMARAASTLDTVRARGVLRCGTENDTPGSGAPDSKGVLQGIDIEYCRGLAVAVFSDATKVEFVHRAGDYVRLSYCASKTDGNDALPKGRSAMRTRNTS